ncbi:hypothetical protein GCM10007424_00390 [Flavobacterium suaedae]|uniref:Uncharacterized protein n=2 Tax=Flavobacterium suaedae TaxID=1767027 RepID=A0ABQ1JBH5_9FLAO|nr:hypothetical protein GCM10007424_00390 [Flavobacterium suaedae]
MAIMTDPNNQANAGDILHGKNNRNVRGIPAHFMIYLSPDPQSKMQFLGAMLTSSAKFGNIALEESHFEKFNNDGFEWQVQFKASFISAYLYHKKNDWQPFTKVGQLSKEGLKFIEDQIGYKEAVFFPFNKD